jgi:hypothetical protein
MILSLGANIHMKDCLVRGRGRDEGWKFYHSHSMLAENTPNMQLHKD